MLLVKRHMVKRISKFVSFFVCFVFLYLYGFFQVAVCEKASLLKVLSFLFFSLFSVDLNLINFNICLYVYHFTMSLFFTHNVLYFWLNFLAIMWQMLACMSKVFVYFMEIHICYVCKELFIRKWKFLSIFHICSQFCNLPAFMT